MNRPSVEELMAFADGELDAVRCQEIDALIAVDPELARQYRVFVDTKEPITQLFAGLAHDAVPERLVSLVRNYDQKSRSQRVVTATPSVRGKSFGGFLRRLSDSLSAPPFVMAGVTGALVCGIAIGTMLSADKVGTVGSQSARSGHLIGYHAPHSTLGAALESSLSGSQMQLARHDGTSTTFEGLLSFRSQDGAYCRQYLVQRSDGNAAQGLACRENERGWTDVVRVATKVGKKGVFKPASGGGKKQIDMIIDGMIAGDVLGVQDEERLIGRGWHLK